MTASEFASILEGRVKRMHEVLAAKSKEYSSKDEYLANLKLTAAILRSTVSHACFSNLCKHLASISSMVDDPDRFDAAVWDEKIGDAVNYLVLLEACVAESRKGASL